MLLTVPVPGALAGMSEYKSTCKDIGFKPGTENFGQCVLKLHARGKGASARNNGAEERRLAAQRQAEEKQQRQIKAWQGFLTGVGKVIDNRAGYVPPSQRQPMRRPTTTDCDVSSYYGTVNCTTR